MPSKRPPWGWRGDGRTSGAEAGSAFFFREMTGSPNREKNYGVVVAGGWFPGTIVDGWRDREEIIAGPQDLRTSGPLQGPPISGNFNSFYRVLPALLVVGDPSWLKKW